MKPKHAAGLLVDEARNLVAVPCAPLDRREDHELGSPRLTSVCGAIYCRTTYESTGRAAKIATHREWILDASQCARLDEPGVIVQGGRSCRTND